MSKHFGFSIFPSTWETQKEQLSSLYFEGSLVFTSLHIAEEFHEAYTEQCKHMIAYCKNIGYTVLADVSKKTLAIFEVGSLDELSDLLGIDIIRIDYGFTLEEVITACNHMPICLNASTLSQKWLEALKDVTHKPIAMHNYYPRPETGLDPQQFAQKNALLKQYGIDAMAFIPSDIQKRGPLHEGLPTLEDHRHLPPYVAYAELTLIYGLSWIFVGDGIVSDTQLHYIKQAHMTSLYTIPSVLLPHAPKHLKNTYSMRPDSPSRLIRLAESREYASAGMTIAPENCVARPCGSITIDNENYLRYSGEIQITRVDLPADPRVNVIGYVLPEYIRLLKAMGTGE